MIVQNAWQHIAYRYGSPTRVNAKKQMYDPLSKTYLTQKEWKVTTAANAKTKKE